MTGCGIKIEKNRIGEGGNSGKLYKKRISEVVSNF